MGNVDTSRLLDPRFLDLDEHSDEPAFFEEPGLVNLHTTAR
jgi:hypothetical protein